MITFSNTVALAHMEYRKILLDKMVEHQVHREFLNQLFNSFKMGTRMQHVPYVTILTFFKKYPILCEVFLSFYLDFVAVSMWVLILKYLMSRLEN